MVHPTKNPAESSSDTAGFRCALNLYVLLDPADRLTQALLR